MENLFQLIILFLVIVITCGESDYYQLLNVPKTADGREIRKAFKKLALVMHPDKNIDDPEAQEKFLKLKQAYDVLKDQQTRQRYDLYGEKGLNEGSQNSREHYNWQFYQNQFGIYDDDPEIITLTASDFEQTMKNSYEFVFVKFYSPMCSHCHTMAPSWRELALQLNTVVKIAVINCADERMLCRQEGISSYPSLVLYPSKEKYYGDRIAEDLQNFVLEKLPVYLVEILNYETLDSILEVERSSPWLFIICSSDTSDCPTWQIRTKLSYFFEELVPVAFIDCSSSKISCSQLNVESEIIYLPAGNATLRQGTEIHSLDYVEIASAILQLLPDAQLMQQRDIEVLAENLRKETGTDSFDWLICFTEGKMTHLSFSTLQYRKLPVLLPQLKFARVDCTLSAELCKSYSISKYPTFAVFKRGGAVEKHVGGVSVSEIVSFARHSRLARNLHSLDPSIFPDCLSDGRPWVIDFYVPWCRPCVHLIPEFRKATSLVGGIVMFGSLDCSVYHHLCSLYNIRSYPTIIFFHNSVPHLYSDEFGAQDIAAFVEDIMHPTVVELTIDNFETLVLERSAAEVWAVDFFAPWCGPCVQLAPQWRRFATAVKSLKDVRVGSVDCVAQQQLCSQQGVRSYPTLRLYPLRRSTNIITYASYQRDWTSLRNWVIGSLPSSVVSLANFDNFAQVVLTSSLPWVVDFYAPWCGPCQTFAHEYELASKLMEGRVKFAKVDCDRFYETCAAASVRAYPTVRFYPGRSENSRQDPAGIAFHSNKRSVEAVVSWLEEQMDQHSAAAAAAAFHTNRDEL